MAVKNYWVLSRPKRKLILVPELLRIFSAVAEGEIWEGNRELQKLFENELIRAQWKAQHSSEDGSGGRTYAILLFLLGLWYKDAEDKVNITLAGKELIAGNSPVPIITKQLLDFQYPSPYSIKSNVNVSSNFIIQPFRFILRLFLETDLTYITQNEIAFCLVPFAKRNSDINSCYVNIHRFRRDNTTIIRSALRSSQTTEDNLKNIGNTFINMIEYSGYFLDQGTDHENVPTVKSIFLNPEKRTEAQEFLSGLRTSFIQNPDNEQSYQRRYGTGLDTTKDYNQVVRTPNELNPNERIVLQNMYQIFSSEPVYGIDENLIRKLVQLTGATPQLIRNVIEKFPITNQADTFKQTFLELSVGGTETATDFEKKTASLFNNGFNFNSLWVGSHPRHPDIFVFIDYENHRFGLLDTKAYKEYNLPLNHKNLMAHTYIPSFTTHNFEDIDFELAFFGYIAGGFSNNIGRSFSELVRMTSIPGHYITANNLINLYREYNSGNVSKNRLFELFRINREITLNDFTV